MNLRFNVDQAECFRRGIDAPKSIVTIDVDPANVPADERNLIADRLEGIDVCRLGHDPNGVFKVHGNSIGHRGRFEEIVCIDPVRLIAKSPDYAGLIEAVRQNQKELEEKAQLSEGMTAMEEALSKQLSKK